MVAWPNPTLTAAVKKACDGGTLAASKAAINEREHSFCKNAGMNCSVDIICIRLNSDGTATQSPPIDDSILDLSVYGPFGMSPEWELNRGRYSSQAVVRAPTGTELTYVAPQTPPVNVPPGKVPPAKVPPAKTPPGKTPPVKKPTTEAGTPLSRSERGWLTPGERTIYDNATAPRQGPRQSRRPGAGLQRRPNRRHEEPSRPRIRIQTTYASYVAAGTYEKIDPFLANVAHYTGPEVVLSAAERDSLLTVLKSSVAHTDFNYPNAQAEYDSQMKPILTAGGGSRALGARPARIVKKSPWFRPMTVPATATPGTGDGRFGGHAPGGRPRLLKDTGADGPGRPLQ